MTKRAVSKARRSDDKRTAGTALNPKKVKGSSGAGAAELKLISFNDRRSSRGAGRPKKAR